MFNVSCYKMKNFLIENDIKLLSRSQRLSIRNKLLCTKPALVISNTANQIILGSLLGDGSIVRKRTNCILTIRHSLI